MTLKDEWEDMTERNELLIKVSSLLEAENKKLRDALKYYEDENMRLTESLKAPPKKKVEPNES